MVFKGYRNIKRLVLAGFMLYGVSLKAQQCTSCTTVITGGSSNFSVNVGQVVCIQSGVTYTGNITLNGGTLCNEGILTHVTFKKGTFNNRNIYSDPDGVTINATGNLIINNLPNARFLITNGMSITSGNLSDTVVFYNGAAAVFNSGKGFSTHDVQFRIYNGDNNGGVGGGGFGVVAVFNIGAAFSVGDATNFRLRNFSAGYFNVAGNMSFNATGNRSVANYGILNVNNAFNVSGTGSSSDLVEVYNNGQFNVTGNISTAINNSNVNINNDKDGAIFSGLSITLSKVTNTLNNDGTVYSGQDIIIQNGKVLNTFGIYATRDTKINNATVYSQVIPHILPLGEAIPISALYSGRNFIIQNLSTLSNSANIVADGYLQVNSATLVNYEGSSASGSSSVVIQSTASVSNEGVLYTSGQIKVTSSSISNLLTGVLLAGTDVFVQTASSAVNNGTMTIGRDLKLTSSTFTNTNLTSVMEEFLPQSSSNVINNGTITAGTNVKITTSTLTNNNYIKAINNFSTTNSTAIFNNNENAFVEVNNEFKNIATVNLGQKSFISASNYINLGTGASINGPFGFTDTALYARIIISGRSNNTGHVVGKIIVHDQSLVGTSGNLGYGFDVLTHPDFIGPDVIFITVSLGPVTPVGTNCILLAKQYLLYTSANPFLPVSPNSPVNLSAQLTQKVTSGPFCPCYFNFNPTPPLIYTWQPSNQTGQNVTVSPPSTQTYTVSTTYLGCTLTGQITVKVNDATYAVLKRSLDGGFYKVNNNSVYFKYDGEYKNNTVLNYKIYTPDRNPPSGLTGCLFNSTISNYGDNRFSIALPPCTPAVVVGQYYVLEIANEKNELFYLKFKY
jgi:hypothetical protein